MLRGVLREALDTLTSLILPAPCRICESLLLEASRIPVCSGCLLRIRPLAGPSCQCCGRPYFSPVAAVSAQPLCQLCRRTTYAFDHARSFAAYDDHLARAIILLKYHAVTSLAGWFASHLADRIAAEPAVFPADTVLPVPLDAARRRERGFNQAELLARPLAKKLGLPLQSSWLLRTRPRPEKLRLSRRERWTTVRGAYEVRENAPVDNLRLLLVDDVFTTGATLDACARALKRAGAAAVTGITVGRLLPAWWSAAAPDNNPGRGGIPSSAGQSSGDASR